MVMQSGYADIAYANSVNSTTEWRTASLANKNYALSMGRFYIDSKYTCIDFDETYLDEELEYPDELLTANSILAEAYLLDTLFITVETTGSMILNRVKAGDVESEKEFSNNGRSPLTIDRFQDVTLLLSQFCSYGNGTRTLTRV